MIRTLCLAALVLAGTPALLAAQDDEEFCPDGRTQYEMNACAAEKLARADSLLNHSYQQLLRVIEPDRVDALREAQRAWIRFRDAECEFQASEVGGGSLQPMVEALCLADLTEKRAEEFEDMLSADN
jgi:uncharacterized protein YecT (DUF1311 family)